MDLTRELKLDLCLAAVLAALCGFCRAGDLDELDSAGLFRFTYASLKRGEATNAFLAARTFLARYGEEEEMTNYFPRMTYFGGLAA